MPTVDLTKPVSYAIMKAILEKRKFTQLSISKETKASLGQVNKVVNFLEKRGFIERENNSFKLKKALAMLEEFAKHRKMKELLIAKFGISIEENEAKKLIAKDAVFCLDTALKEYIPGVFSKRLCFYVTNLETLDRLRAYEGNRIFVYAFKPDLKISESEIKGFRYTDKVQTAIDLVCDNTAYAAAKLFEELWNERII